MKKIAIIGAQYIAILFAKRMEEIGIESHCLSWYKDEYIKNMLIIFIQF